MDHKAALNIEHARFREMGSADGTQLYVSEFPSNRERSMKVLEKKGMRPLTLQEALLRSAELAAELKDMWFYLDGEGPEMTPGIYAFDGRGELNTSPWNEPLDRRIRIWPGTTQLLCIYSFDFYGGHFVLDAKCRPEVIAPVIVGVMKDGGVEKARKAEEPALLSLGGLASAVRRLL